MAGWVGSWSVAIIVHTYHTHLSDHMHQAVANSGGNTIDLALPSTGINGEYIKVSVLLKRNTNALSTTSNSWKTLPRTPHIPKQLPPTNYMLYNIQERRALDGQPYPSPTSPNTCDVLCSNEHYSTYGTQHRLITNNSFAYTCVQRAPTAITLFPPSITLSHATQSFNKSRRRTLSSNIES